MNGGAALAAELQRWQGRVAALGARLGEFDGPRGASPRQQVYRGPGVRLFRYGNNPGRPLLLVFALVNRPYILDLTAQRSLIARLLRGGLNVHLLEWDDPAGGADAPGLDQYLASLDGCVRQLAAPGTPLDLLGVCQGGVFALCYCALNPALVRRLVTMVTPVDFHTGDNALSNLLGGIDTALMTRVLGNIPGALVTQAFLALKPYSLLSKKYLDAALGEMDQERLETFVCMERWIHDAPDLAGPAFDQFVQFFFRDNRLLAGGLRLAGETVDPARLTLPVLNIYAERDHLVPPAGSRALARVLTRAAYSEYRVDAGHIGIYVSQRACRQVPARIVDWLQAD